jgi:hypothetical protein
MSEVVELVEYYAARRISRKLWPTYVKPPIDWDWDPWDHTNQCWREVPYTDKFVLSPKMPTVRSRHIPGLLSLIALDRHPADRNALDALGLLSDPGALVPHAQVIVDLIGRARRRTFNRAALRVLSILPTAKLVAITPEIVRKLAGAEGDTYDWFILAVVPKLPAGALAGSQSAIEELLEHPDWHTRELAVRLFDPSDTIDPWALPREERARHEAAIARRLDDPEESVRRLALKVLRRDNLAKYGDHGD